MLSKIVLRNAAEDHWLCFSKPVAEYNVESIEQVLPVLQEIETRVNSENLYAAGFISYEASPAFDSACKVKYDSGFPLLRFGLYANVETMETLPLSSKLEPLSWQMDSAPAYYREKIKKIKSHIHAGNTYQVNFTVRQHAEGINEAWSLFKHLSDTAPFAAYIECDDWAICSASPELFFALDGEDIFSRPMKGTAPRGETLRDDEEQKSWLRNSEKNRAENLMIVDMIRNDMGRIAKAGTVNVDNLFRVETYPTVLQMTSRINAKTDRSICDIFQALFPCASITGAPKINTMRLITELEDSPRRIYTGTIGYIAPQRKAVFSVAIRTALVNRRNGHVCYGSGGGIVWDSNADEELDEIATKSQILGAPDNRQYFRLFESILWENGTFYLLDRHLQRLQKSAAKFSFLFDAPKIEEALTCLANSLPSKPCKVRLSLAEDGALATEFAELVPASNSSLNVQLSDLRVDKHCVWLRNKTTVRNIYDEARARHPDCDDVLLQNQEGKLTESSIANIAVKVDGQWITPALEDGLLPGTLRTVMLERRELVEKAVTVHDLQVAEELRLFNSVRNWINITLS